MDWLGHRAFDEVLASARAGDELAFAELWRWLHPPLLRWLVVVASSDVEDIESEVWLSTSRGLASFKGDADAFRGWVFTIARRRAIDWGRRRRRQPQTAELNELAIVDVAHPAPSHVDAAVARDSALALLRRLTPDQRESLALRVIVGMSVRETAAVVQKSEGAVRVLCHRGLRALAEQLDAARLAGGVAP
jgi:RNA polymerase sigma-70 factor (ECF subfamily)